jgi:hypothetical protein
VQTVNRTRSSGNVFRDLGFTGKEAEHLTLRAELMVQCSYFRKRFVRRDTNLAKHKMKDRQYECPGRIGYIVRPAR